MLTVPLTPQIHSMNYFELFDFPIGFSVDPELLRKKYFALSRRYHPDYHAQSDTEAQEEALEKAAMVNRAFKVFQNRDETIKYVLQLKGLLEDEEKYQLPPAFLMEVMELNEQLMDAPGEAGLATEVGLRVAALQNEIYEAVTPALEQYIDGISPLSDLLEVKSYYFKKKYLQRIWDKLGGIT
jgi:molecular chaperone HscB